MSVEEMLHIRTEGTILISFNLSSVIIATSFSFPAVKAGQEELGKKVEERRKRREAAQVSYASSVP